MKKNGCIVTRFSVFCGLFIAAIALTNCSEYEPELNEFTITHPNEATWIGVLKFKFLYPDSLIELENYDHQIDFFDDRNQWRRFKHFDKGGYYNISIFYFTDKYEVEKLRLRHKLITRKMTTIDGVTIATGEIYKTFVSDEYDIEIRYGDTTYVVFDGYRELIEN